jgi:hypothetical protein
MNVKESTKGRECAEAKSEIEMKEMMKSLVRKKKSGSEC